MQKEERKAHVLRQLMQKSSVSISELTEIFQISAVSVRKLLADMENEGSIQRIWGGAMLARASSPHRQTSSAARPLPAAEASAKETIAHIAYAQIEDGDSIYLDGGAPMMQELAALLAGGAKRNVILCTNSLPIAFEFRYAGDIRVLFVGGQLHHVNLSCVGGVARQMLETLSLDKCFLSASHLSIARGFTADTLQEAEVKRSLLAISQESYFLMDSSVYGSEALSLVSPCEAGKRLITDCQMPNHVAQALESLGMQVIRVSLHNKRTS